MLRTFLSLLVLSVVTSVAQAAPPNILLIVGDDQGWKDYGCMGSLHVRTPNLDKLATESLFFSHGYVPASLCRASLASMITGLYPHQHKITSNDPPLPPNLRPADAGKDSRYLELRAQMVAEFEKSPSLPKRLAPAGYLSQQSGKWWEGNACRCGGFTAGMTHGAPAQGGRHGDAGLTIGRKGLQPVFDFIDGARKDQQPFFVWYAPMMPHSPHTPPDRLLQKYLEQTPSIHVARYWAMCEWFDETIGELLAHLSKQGLRDNTVVLYLHDNGWIQDPDSPGYAPKSKRSQYDGGLRTPILVSWPGKIQPQRSEALASSIDLAPTILAAAGVKSGSELPGINLLDSAALARRDAVYGAIFEHTAVDIHQPVANLDYCWMIRGNWKLIVPHSPNVKNGAIELYNLARDPDELANLAENEPGRVATLSQQLDAWWPAK